MFFDTETTGIGRWDRVVSIAASCEGTEFYQLVKPPRKIPAKATEIHGITNEAVAAAPSWFVVGRRFWQWVIWQAAGRQVVFVAHNASFDIRMLRSETARMYYLPPLPPVLVVDTLKVCRQTLGGLPNYKQATVYKHLYGVEPEGQHDALGDVRALARICAHARLVHALTKHATDVPPFLKSDKPPKWAAEQTSAAEDQPAAAAAGAASEPSPMFTAAAIAGKERPARAATAAPSSRIGMDTKRAPTASNVHGTGRSSVVCSVCERTYSTFFSKTHACEAAQPADMELHTS